MIELNKHIEILLLSNDCVIVPGFGGFMAHYVVARKDPSDGSFLPPKRSIGFNPKLVINDSLLAQSYVEAYDISYPEATMRIEDEVRELKLRIETEGSYDFDGIGTISLNDEGNYEFAPCEAGILTPSLYGLDSFKMKDKATVRKALMAKMAAAKAPAVADAEESVEDSDDITRKPLVVAMWRNVAVACIAIILFLIIPAPLTKDIQMAGNNIDTSLLDRVMPKDITTGGEKVVDAMKSHAVATANVNNEAVKTQPEAKLTDEADYAIVVASHVTLKNAHDYADQLTKKGFNNARVYRDAHVKVLVGAYSSKQEADDALDEFRAKHLFDGAWVKKIK